MSVTRTILACLLATAASTAAADGAFDGLWRSSPTAECAFTGDDGGALKIEDGRLFGIGSTCEMTIPVNVRDMDAILFDMVCTGKERSWTDRAMFMNAADGGLVLVWNGYAFKYDRCPEDAALGTVTTSDDIGIRE